MKNKVKYYLLCAAAFAFCGCSEGMSRAGDELLAQHKLAILQGTELSFSTPTGVVAIIVKDHPEYQNQVVCTGTLIAPKYVLTAAHCVAELSSQYLLYHEEKSDPDCKWQGGNISIGASDIVNYLKIGTGPTLNSSLVRPYDINKIIYHSGYSTLADSQACTQTNYDGYSVTRNDIAILELKQPVDEFEMKPVPILPPWLGLSQELVEKGIEASFVGYGYDENGNRGVRLETSLPIEMYCPAGNGLLCPYSKTVHVQGCHPDSFLCSQYGKLDYYENKLAVPVGAFFYLQKEGGPCQGDSGGPAFVTIGNQSYLAGLTSYGDNACSSYGISTAVQDYYDWIIKNAPDAKNEIKEICGNGLDDDNNGKADAGDPYCNDKSYCGDGKLDTSKEQCDGDLFLDQMTNCADWSYEYESGTVSCADNCGVDFSQCIKASIPDTCGNHTIEIENGEQCDGDVFRDGYGYLLESNLCSEFSAFFISGYLKCNDNCTVDTSKCTYEIDETPYCGDGILQKGELCDKEQFVAGASNLCKDWDARYKEGYVRCNNCKPDFSECLKDSICGDGKLSYSELCDGKLFLADETSCTEWATRMSGGQVKCNANCSLDFSSCQMEEQYVSLCGNKQLDDNLLGTTVDHYGEECDGDLFKNGTECHDWDDRYISGKVRCNSNCTVNLEQCILGSNALYLDETSRSSLYLLNSQSKPTLKAPDKAGDSVIIILGGSLKENLPSDIFDGEDDSDNPDVPDNPGTPDISEKPDNPDVPDNPVSPVDPGTPDSPDNPGVADNPGAPDDSDKPDSPVVPDEPLSPINQKDSSGCSTMSLLDVSNYNDTVWIFVVLCMVICILRRRTKAILKE